MLKNNLVNYCLSILKLVWKKYKALGILECPAQSYRWRKSPRSTHSSYRHDLTLSVSLFSYEPKQGLEHTTGVIGGFAVTITLSENQQVEFLIDNFLFEFTSKMNYNKPGTKSLAYYLRSVKKKFSRTWFLKEWRTPWFPRKSDEIISFILLLLFFLVFIYLNQKQDWITWRSRFPFGACL